VEKMSRPFSKFWMGVAFATGYVLGAQAGRRRYEQLVGLWNEFVGSPLVRRAALGGRDLLGQAGQKLTEQARARIGSERELRQVMSA
jgi:hypothetical protein